MDDCTLPVWYSLSIHCSVDMHASELSHVMSYDPSFLLNNALSLISFDNAHLFGLLRSDSGLKKDNTRQPRSIPEFMRLTVLFCASTDSLNALMF
jgi:hypothetical protein